MWKNKAKCLRFCGYFFVCKCFCVSFSFSVYTYTTRMCVFANQWASTALQLIQTYTFIQMYSIKPNGNYLAPLLSQKNSQKKLGWHCACTMIESRTTLHSPKNGQFEQTQFNKRSAKSLFLSTIAHLKIDCTYMMYGHFLANYGSFVGSISFAFA